MQTQFEDITIHNYGTKNTAKNLTYLLKRKLNQSSGYCLLAGTTNTVNIWNGKTGARINKLYSPSTYTTAFLNNSEIALGGGEVTIWNFKTNSKRKLSDNHKDLSHCRLLSPKQNLLIMTQSRIVEVWDTAESTLLAKYTHRGPSMYVDITTILRLDDEWVAMHCYNEVFLYNYEQFKVGRVFSEPDNLKISNISEHNGQVYMHTIKKLLKLDVKNNTITQVGPSQGSIFSFEIVNDKLIAMTKAMSIYLVNDGVKTELSDNVTTTLSKAGDLLAFQERNWDIVLYDTGSNTPLFKLKGLRSECSALCYFKQ